MSIRNVAICGEPSSGKSSLVHLLINNNNHQTNSTQILFETFQSQLYSTSLKLNSHHGVEVNSILNLVDCIGRLESLSQVKADLRLTDGCIMVVDASLPTFGKYSELVLRQISQENIPLVVLFNKLDEPLMDCNVDLEEINKSIQRIVDSVNLVMSTFNTESKLSLESIVFGSTKQGWAFTLKHFAMFYSKQFGMNQDELLEKLWGDCYYDAENGKWTNQSNDNIFQRSFCQFILKPIRSVLAACEKSEFNVLEEVLNPFVKSLSKTEYTDLSKQELINSTMQKWLSANNSIHELIFNQLPSAPYNRAKSIYSGSITDKFGTAIKNCDPCGPLVVHVSSNKIINGKIYAISRIFSGSLKSDTIVRVFNSKQVFEEKSLRGIVKINGTSIEPIEEASCQFNPIIGLIGIESCLTNKGSTITESTELEAKPFISDSKSNLPMINVYVEPKKQAYLPKLIRGLELIYKCDSSLSFTLDEYTGEKILTVFDEKHLDSVLHQFKQLHPSIELEVSGPIVKYQETVTSSSANITLVKTPNKHNRLWLTTEPLKEDVISYFESGKLPSEPKQRGKILNENFGWDLVDAKKIWSLCENSLNVFVDKTQQVCYLNEIKDAVILGFHIATREGPLCNELMRGVRFNLKDVVMYSDAIHRGTGQIAPTVKRGCYASVLDAEPSLLEPISLMEFKCKKSELSAVYSILNSRRGVVIEEQHTSSVFGKAFLPVSESFGVLQYLDQYNVSSQFIFDHWQPIPANSSQFHDIVYRTRLRKGLPEKLPCYSELVDKL